MSNVAGFNPLRWKCEKNGCFNIKRRPKIEQFAQCFPGLINFGDVDGLVEINSSFLFLEWKSGGGLPTGQKILYQRLTQNPDCIVMVVEGDPEHMTATRYSLFSNGRQTKWIDGSIDDVKDRMKSWAVWAKNKQLKAVNS